jgi:hypothetical protein
VILRRLAAVLREEGGLIADALYAEPRGVAKHGRVVEHGPRAAGHPADLPLVVEAVREGYLLHYGEGRLLGGDDEDLALLAGDRLYALGLERLAAAGDLAAVRALADLIALSAQAQAAGDEDLAAAVWAAGCAEVGWGLDDALRQAKEAARAGNSAAVSQLRDAARLIIGDRVSAA